MNKLCVIFWIILACSLVNAGCGGSCFNSQAGDAGDSSAMMPKESCVPQSNTSSDDYSCAGLCSKATQCDEFDRLNDVDECVRGCNESSSYQPGLYEEVVSCLQNRGGISCNSMVICAADNGFLGELSSTTSDNSDPPSLSPGASPTPAGPVPVAPSSSMNCDSICQAADDCCGFGPDAFAFCMNQCANTMAQSPTEYMAMTSCIEEGGGLNSCEALAGCYFGCD